MNHDNSKKDVSPKRPFIDMYSDSKLNFKSLKFWLFILLTPILIIGYKLFFIIGISLFYENIVYLIKTYFAGCFFMFIILSLIDYIQMTIKDFKKRNLTGKILLIIVFIFFIVKAIFEISQAKN